MPLNLDNFKVARRLNGLNRWSQILLTVSFFLGLNILASRSDYHTRWSLQKSPELSLETRKSFEILERRVEKRNSAAKLQNGTGEKNDTGAWVNIYVTFCEEEFAGDAKPFAQQIRDLCDDFIERANGNERTRGWLKIQNADPVRNANTRGKLFQQIGEITQNDALVVVCENGTGEPRKQKIQLTELAKVRDNEVIGFCGEEALISALLKVTNEKQSVIYFTNEHGEMRTNDTGLRGVSTLKMRMESRDVIVKPLELSKFNEVPDDAAVLVIAAPNPALKMRFSPADVEKLRRYTRNRNGRIIVLLDIGANCGLEKLFDDWGILADDILVYDGSSELNASGAIVLKAGKNPHPLTEMLLNTGAYLAVNQARVVRFDLGSPLDDTLKVSELIGTGNSRLAWGERDYTKPPFIYEYDRGDLLAPVPAVAIAERVIGRSQNVEISGGRLLVIGSGDIAANSGINEGLNEYFMMNAVNWMLDRSEFLNIQPRPIAQFNLKATNADLIRTAKWFLIPPGAIFLLGIAVSSWRRRT